MAKSKSVNSLDMFGNMSKLNTKPARQKNNDGLTSDEVKKKLHITFYNDDKIFDETELEVNEVASAPSETPTKASDTQYDYTFAGWSPEFTNLKEDTEYHAEYTKTLRIFQVTFRVDTKIIETQHITYGELPTAPTVPVEKADDETYHYNFFKWEPALTLPVTDNTEIQAIFSKELIHHTVTFLDATGNELRKIAVAHGEPAAYNFETPIKVSDEAYDYAFIGWDNADQLKAVTDDFTVTPVYEKTPKETVKITEAESPLEDFVEVNESVISSVVTETPVRVTASNTPAEEPFVSETISYAANDLADKNTVPVKAKVGRPATKKGIAKKVNVLFTEDTMDVINTAKVFFDGNMTKYLETLIMEDYKKNKNLYDTLAKTKRI